jgi:hypothetical protein
MHDKPVHPGIRHRVSILGPVFLLCLSLAGCELVGAVFKVGVWAGIITVAVVVVAIAFLVRLVTGPRRG